MPLDPGKPTILTFYIPFTYVASQSGLPLEVQAPTARNELFSPDPRADDGDVRRHRRDHHHSLGARLRRASAGVLFRPERQAGPPGIEILGKIFDIKTMAQGRGIRELDRLRKVYGPGRWKKRKGISRVRLAGGQVVTAEVHWYEAHEA